MEKTRILFITQEITPYVPETEISVIGRQLPQGIQDKGFEIRAFMPKFGIINERRNQLHEVIRLSGMNLIIEDTDHPLIIKVASIQSARMQVYFIDNDDYFHRKHMLYNDKGETFADNEERNVFFIRGVIETVKKLCWSPDLVHCHGWFTAIFPLYLKRSLHDNPLFNNTKVVYSLYDDDFKTPLNTALKNKILIEGVSESDVAILDDPTYFNINRLAVDFADGVIIANNRVNPQVREYIEKSNKPVLVHPETDYISAYADFYETILAQ